ncbi:TraB/GumN family protein [Ensifer soli]|uniref:TraB/GumN family protein n=1 Tax=Ciceribacter sp. sgz301302 TaxID=3342379 RepID=UPI0035B969C5
MMVKTGAELARQVGERAAEGLLWLLAGLHVAALTLLFVTLVLTRPAHAETPACGGRDLMAEFARTAPQTIESMRREAAAIPNGKGVFWKIEKPGVAPSYLLGTMHVTDPRVLAMPKGAPAAFDAAGTVVVESDEIVDDRKAAAAMLTRPDLTMFTDGRTIEDFLKPGEKDALEAGLKQRGIPLALVAKMKPWIIASFVAMPACETSRKAAGASFLDKRLAEDALKQGKQLKGLETLAEQLEAMNALAPEFHLSALIETLALGDTIADVMETTSLLYLSGETGMIMPMMKAVSQEKTGDTAAASTAFEQKIITERNHTMATRAAPILDAGNAFIAIGALHLPGREGVIELLRADGYTVTAVD